jgi:hypothetical protein
MRDRCVLVFIPVNTREFDIRKGSYERIWNA